MNEDATQAIRVEEREFLSCRYVRKQANGTATMQWITPTAVFVTIELAGEGPEKNFRRTWDGAPVNMEKLQQMFSGIEEQRRSGSDDFTLQLFRKGDRFATLVWSIEDEPEALARLRLLLERAGHLACAEAMACWRRGHTFGAGTAYSQAIDSFRKGINSLGNAYWHKELIDDTAMRLVLAEGYEKTGEMEMARNLFERVLQSRINEYLNLQSLASSVEQWEK